MYVYIYIYTYTYRPERQENRIIQLDNHPTRVMKHSCYHINMDNEDMSSQINTCHHISSYISSHINIYHILSSSITCSIPGNHIIYTFISSYIIYYISKSHPPCPDRSKHWLFPSLSPNSAPMSGQFWHLGKAIREATRRLAFPGRDCVVTAHVHRLATDLHTAADSKHR